MLNSTVEWFYLFALIFFILTAIAWILFARLTMARIEKSMEADGLPKGFAWDGVGGRVVFYAYAIILSEKNALRIERLIDVRLIRDYANANDWWRGLFFIVVTNLWLIITFVGAAITD